MRGKKYSENELIEFAGRIIANIEKKGFLRYDNADIKNLTWISKRTTCNRLIRIIILLIDEFFPILFRRVLGIKKTNFVTAYTHIAEAYLISEKNNISTPNLKNSRDICMEGLNMFCKVDNEYIWWDDYENEYFYPNKNIHSRPTLNLHCLTRYNILLIEIGQYYNDYNLIKLAYHSVLTTLKQHQVTYHENGAISISYYYNSDDCTLNVNSEFAHWLSLIPEREFTTDLEKILNGLVKLLISEQNEDGSWYYYSKFHMKKFNEKGIIDCNHTGTVIYNILNILKSKKLDKSLQDQLVESINKGVFFYINNLIKKETGIAKNIIGYSRPAGPVQYAEAIFSLCEFVQSESAYPQLKNEVFDLLPKIICNIVGFIKKDGSAPGERIIRWVNIDSIRWGNGPILQAILSFMAIKKRYNIK